MKNPKAKGTRFEREVKKAFEEAGFTVVRSAASFGKADLLVEGIGSIQCKVRKTYNLYNLFDDADFLVLKADRKKPLIVMSLTRFLKLLKSMDELKN